MNRSIHRNHPLGVVISAAFVLPLASAAVATEYDATVIPLPTVAARTELSGGLYLARDGQVLNGAACALWTGTQVIQPLFQGVAHGVAGGVVAGDLDGMPWRAVRWRSTGVEQLAEPLPLDPQDIAVSHAAAINAHGDVAGWLLDATTRKPHACVWSAGGETTDLGAGKAIAIDANGDVVGSSGDAVQALTVWTSGGAIDLSQARGANGEGISDALIISDARVVAGFGGIPGGTAQAVIWRGGDVIELAPQGPRGSLSRPIAFAASGAVLVSYQRQPDNVPAATVWRDGVFDEVVPPAGWTIFDAWDMDDAGRILVTAIDAARTRSAVLLLTPRAGPTGGGGATGTGGSDGGGATDSTGGVTTSVSGGAAGSHGCGRGSALAAAALAASVLASLRARDRGRVGAQRR